MSKKPKQGKEAQGHDDFKWSQGMVEEMSPSLQASL
jgi:hypothetical protein